MLKLKDIIKESVLKEYSPNDPIPELNRRKQGLAIALLGPPAAGKTTFYKNFIVPKQGKLKRFSTDDISDLRRKWDPEHKDKEQGEYVPGSSALRTQYIEQFVEGMNNDNFVIDTTGRDPSSFRPIYDVLKENGYDVIFIHVLIPVKKALNRVKKRNIGKDQPETDIEYTKSSYTDPEQLSKSEFASFSKEALSTNRAQKIISEFSSWGNDEYYLVVDVGKNRIFMKHENGQIKVRKGDKYISVN